MRKFGDPAPFTVLVVEATGLDQRMKLGKAAGGEDAGGGMRFGRERWRAASGCRGACAGDWEKQGAEFEKGAAEDLAEFVAADLMRLKTEIEKLATYAAERKMIRVRTSVRCGFGKDDDSLGIG